MCPDPPSHSVCVTAASSGEAMLEVLSLLVFLYSRYVYKNLSGPQPRSTPCFYIPEGVLDGKPKCNWLANLSSLMTTFGFQVLKTCIWFLWDVNEPILFSRWICTPSSKNYYILESLQDKKHCKCLPYMVPLLGTQNRRYITLAV